MRRFIPLAVITFAATQTVAAEESRNLANEFINAADVNDATKMNALLSNDVTFLDGRRVKSADFIASLSSCYLRRVYANPNEPGQVVPVWMCTVPNKPDHSRVVQAHVANTDKGLLLFQAYEQPDNARPAPPRLGSALAPEPKQ